MYHPTSRDVPEDDPYAGNPDRVAEVARELYWRDFQAHVRQYAADISWPELMLMVSDVMRSGADAYSPVEQELEDFANAEGWASCLHALARAMEQQ